MKLMTAIETSGELQPYQWYNQHEDGVICVMEKKLTKANREMRWSTRGMREQKCLLSFLLAATAQKKAFTTSESVVALLGYVGKLLGTPSSLQRCEDGGTANLFDSECGGRPAYYKQFNKTVQKAATLVTCLFTCAGPSLMPPSAVGGFFKSLSKALCGLISSGSSGAKHSDFVCHSTYYSLAAQTLSVARFQNLPGATGNPAVMQPFVQAVLQLLVRSDGAVVKDPCFLSFASAAIGVNSNSSSNDGVTCKEVFLGLAQALRRLCSSSGNSRERWDVGAVLWRLLLVLGDLMMVSPTEVVEEVSALLFTESPVVQTAVRALCYFVEVAQDLRGARCVLHFFNAALLRGISSSSSSSSSSDNSGRSTFFLVTHILNCYDHVAAALSALFYVLLPRNANITTTTSPLKLQALSFLANFVEAYAANRFLIAVSEIRDALGLLLRPFTAGGRDLAVFYRECLSTTSEQERFACVMLSLARCFKPPLLILPSSSSSSRGVKTSLLREQLRLYVAASVLEDFRTRWLEAPDGPCSEASALRCAASSARVALLALCEMLPPIKLLDNVPREAFALGGPGFGELTRNAAGVRMALEASLPVVAALENGSGGSGGGCCVEEAKREVRSVARLLLVVYTFVVAVQVKMIEAGKERIPRLMLKAFKFEVNLVLKKMDVVAQMTAVGDEGKSYPFAKVAGNLLLKANRIVKV